MGSITTRERGTEAIITIPRQRAKTIGLIGIPITGHVGNTVQIGIHTKLDPRETVGRIGIPIPVQLEIIDMTGKVFLDQRVINITGSRETTSHLVGTPVVKAVETSMGHQRGAERMPVTPANRSTAGFGTVMGGVRTNIQIDIS